MIEPSSFVIAYETMECAALSCEQVTVQKGMAVFCASTTIPDIFCAIENLHMQISIHNSKLLKRPIHPYVLSYKTMTLSLPLSFNSSIFFFCNFSKAGFCIIFPLGNSILTCPFIGKILSAS